MGYNAESTSHDWGQFVPLTGVSPSGLGADFIERLATYEPKLLILLGRTINLQMRKDSADYQDRTTQRQKMGSRARLEFAKANSIRAARCQRISYVEPVDGLVNNDGVIWELFDDHRWDRAPIWHEPWPYGPYWKIFSLPIPSWTRFCWQARVLESLVYISSEKQ